MDSEFMCACLSMILYYLSFQCTNSEENGSLLVTLLDTCFIVLCCVNDSMSVTDNRKKILANLLDILSSETEVNASLSEIIGTVKKLLVVNII